MKRIHRKELKAINKRLESIIFDLDNINSDLPLKTEKDVKVIQFLNKITNDIESAADNLKAGYIGRNRK